MVDYSPKKRSFGGLTLLPDTTLYNLQCGVVLRLGNCGFLTLGT